MAKIYDLSGKPAGEIKLPAVFSTPYRPDVIQRAVLAMQSQRRQPYGADVLAGKRTSAHYHGNRHYRFTMMNREMSRLPRIHGRAAGWMAFRARFTPHAVKGREAHPPMVEKVWAQKVNKKEYRLAIASGLAASLNRELLKLRGHRSESPVVLADDFENMRKAKEVEALFGKIGISAELERCREKKVRAGRGKMRGRRYQKKKGVLVITAEDCSAIKACRNLPGVDATTVEGLSVEHLAPGCQAGRLIVMTKSAVAALGKKFGE